MLILRFINSNWPYSTYMWQAAHHIHHINQPHCKIARRRFCICFEIKIISNLSQTKKRDGNESWYASIRFPKPFFVCLLNAPHNFFLYFLQGIFISMKKKRERKLLKVKAIYIALAILKNKLQQIGTLN